MIEIPIGTKEEQDQRRTSSHPQGINKYETQHNL